MNFIELWLVAIQLFNIDSISIDRLYLSLQNHRRFQDVSDSDGKGENYQRALTLLNEAVDILRSPYTSTDHPQQLPAHRSVGSVQVPATSERDELKERRVFFHFTVRAPQPVKLVRVNPSKRFRPSASASGLKKSFKPKETWTHTFICLCKSDQLVVPSRERNVICGRKKNYFDKYGGYQQLQSSLLKEFPKLSEGGGFQLLRSSGARRSLDLIPIPTMGYDIPYLKDCLGQAIGYVRLLQKDLDRSPLSVQVG